MDAIPIIDAHQHFWDIGKNYLPWLRDEPPIPFRYGDYGALKRNYLPDDYRRDSAGFTTFSSSAAADGDDNCTDGRYVETLMEFPAEGTVLLTTRTYTVADFPPDGDGFCAGDTLVDAVNFDDCVELEVRSGALVP